MGLIEAGDGWELRCGDYREVLADVEQVDAVICDPPYSERTHKGHNNGANLADKRGAWLRSNGKRDEYRARRPISYGAWAAEGVEAFVAWADSLCGGWFVAMSDSGLLPAYHVALAPVRTTFQPVPCVIPGMTVRLAGDGPSSWSVYLNVARPKSLKKWALYPGRT